MLRYVTQEKSRPPECACKQGLMTGLLLQVLKYAAGRLLASTGILQAGVFSYLGPVASMRMINCSPRGDNSLQQQQHKCPAWHALTAPRHISSSTAAGDQQQQQQQRSPTPNEEAQNLSKAFLTNVLDAEELWLKGVAGQLKMWVAAKKIRQMEVRVRDSANAGQLLH